MSTTAIKAKQRPGDRVFRSAVFAGSMILVTLAAVAIFLIVQSIPRSSPTAKTPRSSRQLLGLRRPLVFGTIWAAALALIMAVPISIGIALSSRTTRRAARLGARLHRRPARRGALGGVRPLGHRRPRPAVQPIYTWLVENLGWFPLFSGPVSHRPHHPHRRIVLAVMCCRS